MSRFAHRIGAVSLVIVVVTAIGLLFLKARVSRLPFEVQTRLKEKGIEFSFLAPQVRLTKRSLSLGEVSLRRQGDAWKATASRCVLQGSGYSIQRIVLTCEEMKLTNTEKGVEIPGGLEATISGFTTNHGRYSLNFDSPAEAPSRLFLKAEGSFSEDRLTLEKGSLQLVGIEVETGSRLDSAFSDLRSVPLLGQHAGAPPRSLRVLDLNGALKYENGNGEVTNVRLRSERFEIESESIRLRDNQLSGSLRFIPNSSMMPPVAQSLTASENRLAIPVELGGTATEPTFNVDRTWLLAQAKTVIQRGISEETKEKIKHEYESKWKGQIQNFIQERLRRRN